MKRMLPLILVLALTGCRWEKPPAPSETFPTAAGTTLPTEQTGTARTDSAAFLRTVWASFQEMVPFSVFGGSGHNPVWDGPGDLDLAQTGELRDWYMIPEAYLSRLHSGASLVHLMNPSILTLTAVRLQDPQQEKLFLRAWQNQVQEHRWPCDKPHRFLIAAVDRQMVMAYGWSDVMEDLRRNLTKAFPMMQIQYYGALPEQEEP